MSSNEESADVSAAVRLYEQGYGCSQSVAVAYGPSVGLDEQTAAKVSAGFGGGMRMGGACGAVTGAFMIIGMKFGNASAEDVDAKKKTNRLVKELTKQFRERNGSVICKELLSKGLSAPEGEKGKSRKVCPKMVQDACEILEELLADQ